MTEKINKRTFTRIKNNCPVKCKLLDYEIKNLSEYFAIISSLIAGGSVYWFRGHDDITWSLVPSALRFDDELERKIALSLLDDFQRIAEIRLKRPPNENEYLSWLQLAQHYGIPTRLLDWTESALFGLFFACYQPNVKTHGIVYFFNPKDLEKLSKKTLTNNTEENAIDKYSELGPKRRKIVGLPTLAVEPKWNSERIMMQRGFFTLHGSINFELDEMILPHIDGHGVKVYISLMEVFKWKEDANMTVNSRLKLFVW